MKKTLLASSVLAAFVFACAAHADTPTITVGGVIDWQMGHISDDADANQRAHAFRNDTEINFNVDGKADNGLGYGAVIVLEADVTNDGDNQGTNAAETYVYLDGSWGRVQLGSTTGASAAMKVDAASIARATGGIDGSWTYFANYPGSTTLITTPNLPITYGIHVGGTGDEAQENTNKITYYTPRWSGLQLGLSYAPNDSDKGQVINRADNRAAIAAPDGFFNFSRAENIISGGLNYEATYDQLGVAAAATFERGDAESAGFEDLFAWDAGLQLNYMGFAAAASYGYWGDSLGTKGLKNDTNSYWTVGGAYETGPYGVSVTYLDSTVERSTGFGKNDFNIISLGADYQLAEGLTPYVELSLYEMDAAVAAQDNDGHVFLVGTMLNF